MVGVRLAAEGERVTRAPMSCWHGTGTILATTLQSPNIGPVALAMISIITPWERRQLQF